MSPAPHTIAVCEAHYKAGSGCGRCPIREACHSSPSKLSDDSMSAWIERCNQAAENVKEQ